MARLLLIVTLLAAGLGMLPLGRAPGSLRFAAAATGDRWVWPGPPNVREKFGAFYDARRGRLEYLADDFGQSLWSLQPDTPRVWTAVPIRQGATPPRLDMPKISDPTGDRVFYLEYDFVPDDTCCTGSYHLAPWELSLGNAPAWSQLPVRALGPGYGDGSMMAYDSRRQRLLVFGGRDPLLNRGLSDSVYTLDVSADNASWTGFAADAPPLPVRSALAVYDSVTDRVLVYAGRDSLGRGLRNVYALDLGAPTGWEKWDLPDSMATFEALSFDPQLLLDTARRRLLLVNAHYAFPGDGIPIDSYVADSALVWQLDLDTRAGWTPVPYVGPSPDVTGAEAAFDPVRNRLTLYGCAERDDLAELVLDGNSAWSVPQRSDDVPNFGDGANAVLDRKHERALVVSNGGRDLWAMQRGVTDTWEEPKVYSSGPTTRSNPVVVFDSLGQRGVFYGGGGSNFELGDVWQFTLDDSNRVFWQRLFPDGEPPTPRWRAAAVYDPVRHRIVVFGGYAGHPLGDTWALMLDPPLRWQKIPDRGLPPSPRSQASAVYDSRRDAMIVYGGNLGSIYERDLTDETWVLSFADGDVWLPLSALGRAPAPRCAHGAVYDVRRDRMIVCWGFAFTGGRTDCAELDLADGPTWRTFAPDGPAAVSRASFSAFYDPDRDQALMFGGQSTQYYNANLPTNFYADFSANAVTSPPPLIGPPLAVLGFAPNPTRDVENVAFDLPVDATVRARIYDARGRLVRDLGPKSYVAGRHLLLWDGKNRLGEIPPSGVYFARLSILGKDFSGKFVLLH